MTAMRQLVGEVLRARRIAQGSRCATSRLAPGSASATSPRSNVARRSRAPSCWPLSPELSTSRSPGCCSMSARCSPSKKPPTSPASRPSPPTSPSTRPSLRSCDTASSGSGWSVSSAPGMPACGPTPRSCARSTAVRRVRRSTPERHPSTCGGRCTRRWSSRLPSAEQLLAKSDRRVAPPSNICSYYRRAQVDVNEDVVHRRVDEAHECLWVLLVLKTTGRHERTDPCDASQDRVQEPRSKNSERASAEREPHRRII